ncbi:hypothetical protein WN944_019360 [Citrus x changshan-huyou]|uniref:glucan endo-1,3-beta-D-glucosidase n=1 Tax=Citrus x changshan-huyou TaxID=2935761 RepID=A0AAP0LWG4_9ROSI
MSSLFRGCCLLKRQGNGKWNIRHFRMLTATENIQNALNDAGVGDSVKASVPLNADVYESPENNPYPSFGRFRTDILGQTAQIVKFLAKNNVPFAVNIYPFPSLYGNDDFPFNYVFFDGGNPIVDSGTRIQYTNVFLRQF